MIFCIAVFKSRTQLREFCEYMRARGVSCGIINTPSEAHVGCGLSAKFSYSSLKLAREVVFKKALGAFYGFFMVEKNNNSSLVKRI